MWAQAPSPVRFPAIEANCARPDSRGRLSPHTPHGIQHCMIRKTPKGYVLLSKTMGRKLGGPYKTREQALKRERQVQFFKRRKAA